MAHLVKRRLLVASILILGAALGGTLAFVRLSRKVDEALGPTAAAAEPLRFSPLAARAKNADRWGGGEVTAVAVTPTSLITAGAFGVADESGLLAGLPTLRASALAVWRGRTVVGLDSGGLFLRRDAGWEEAQTGFGVLHVRDLVETPGGELLIGAREGLFRTAWGSSSLERLDRAPVKSIALGPGGSLFAGGEDGLRRVEATRTIPVAAPDPWTEWVGVHGREIVAITAAGLARGPLGGPLAPLSGGDDARSAAIVEDKVYAVTDRALLRFEGSGSPAEEILPAEPTRVFAVQGFLFADTQAGLFRRAPSGWALIRPRPSSLPAGPSHVNALAFLDSRLVLGLFDGGLVVAEGQGSTWSFRAVPDASAWGVNALLPAGGALYIASLRGAARFDGKKVVPLEGPGAAFSLAATRDGVAIGYGQGVLLPGPRLLSAFHGLPGNQALALASGNRLFVGTPSGLGALAGSRVAWRVVAGEGKLPHPWVTSLALFREALYVGTYGGGVARRSRPATDEDGSGAFEAFVETEGLKVNSGCLVEAGGRLYLGTDGGGLFRLSRDGRRFAAVAVGLPSPRVTALAAGAEALFVGTDEGLARISLIDLDEES